MNTNNERNCGSTSSSATGWVINVVTLLTTVLVGVSDAGISGNGITSRGRITQFGSIFVNNREFDISNAKIVLDGQLGNETDLKLGQVVFVRGLLDDTLPVGDATEVIFGDNVEGPITSIDADQERLTVLGQTVLTDAQTVYELRSGSNSFDELDLNEQIEVSGFLTVDGEILASRIEQKIAAGQNEVIGTVSNLTGSTFTFNALTVDFSGAELINFATGYIVEGNIVEVKGTDFGINGELIALQVEQHERISGDFGELGEFEGLISNFDSAYSFSVGGVAVSTNADTSFIGGGKGNLAANVSVEVAGEFDDDGILVVSKVIIRGTRIRIHAEVDSISSSSFTALGITATTDSNTRWRDNGPIDADQFSLAKLYVGDYVEVRSFKNSTSTTSLRAESVNREDPETEVRLQGFVSHVGEQGFQIHGVTINVRNSDFSDANDKPISASAFINVLTEGTFVKVTGTETTSMSIDASDAGLRLDD